MFILFLAEYVINETTSKWVVGMLQRRLSSFHCIHWARLICSRELSWIQWDKRINCKIAACERYGIYVIEGYSACCVHCFVLRTFDTNQSNSGVSDASVLSSLCLSAARYVGLGSRAERQSEGESDRKRHAGSDGQSGDFTGRWRLCWRTKSDFCWPCTSTEIHNVNETLK